MRSKSLAAIFILSLLSGALPHTAGNDRDQFIFRSTYRLENRGNVSYAVTEEDATLSLFMDSKWQTVTTRNASHEILKQLTDVDGNPIAVMDIISEIEPSETLIFSIEYVISAEGIPRPEISLGEAGTIDEIPARLVERYTGETETFSRNEEIEALARKLAAEEATVLGVVTRLIGWILANVSYCNFDTPLYPYETYDDLQGDCDDQAILLISMLRSLGIPAHLQIGVVFSQRIESEKSSWGGHLTYRQNGVGWHGWAMVYVPPWGWIPIDLTLTSAREPLEMILRAPEYESSIVPAFNVSRQPYIGESRSSRELLMASDMYITVSDVYIDEKTVSGWPQYVYVGAGIAAGATILIVFLYGSRRRSSPLAII